MALINEALAKTAFVIPCFNDSATLERVLCSLPDESLKIVIDDGSKNPVNISLDSSEFSLENLVMIRHFMNLGQGAAIETGFELIRRQMPHVEYIFTFDSDGQHRFQDAHNMLAEMLVAPCDVILGSRFLGQKGMMVFQGGKLKYILLRFAAWLSKFTLGIKVSDRHNGLRLLRRRALDSLKLNINGYGHADEFLLAIAQHNLSYREVSVEIRHFKERNGQPTLNAFKIVFDRFWGGK